jgi:hypothetical protein
VTSDAGGGDAASPQPGDAAPETTNAAAPNRLTGRARVGYALLFSVPVGVGVAAAMMRMTGGGPSRLVVFGPGVVAAAALFALVYVAARDASP